MRVYLDTSVVIYLVERIEPFCSVALNLIPAQAQLVSSELALAESLVVPFRQQNPALIQAYRSFFQTVLREVSPVSWTVLEQAAQLRAVHRFTLLDAVHCASAMAAGCDWFLTNDTDLRSFVYPHCRTIILGDFV
ncbi:MAG: PIN domain-containing protein [Fimbriimonadales bacterium]|nr:PIN domain-containing protein [Fimbriimonadales bacterium]